MCELAPCVGAILLTATVEVTVCVTVFVVVFAVVKVGEDTGEVACCWPERLALGESIRCRRLDMVSCSLRGDLGD